jgi:dihydrofolate synthase/folylpolyglutamate synthase
MIQPFDQFLQAKPLYYKEIDHQRVHQAYTLLKPHIKHPKTVHIVGTNGKGSTGRMISHLAYRQNLKVGHFSSPHIRKFNERIWINGEESSDAVLENAHQKLYPLLGQQLSEGLSYFEYTTLLALVVFESCDLIVLEAGLGGEYDATNVCDKVLSVITPIGLDHQAFLGETIEAIATTKIRSIQKEVLLAPQRYDEVERVARQIASERNAILHLSHCDSVKKEKLEAIAKQKGWASYLVENGCVALGALDILEIRYAISDLSSLELFGRFYSLRENIHIDVGHNPLAAEVIVKALKEKVVLVYNSLDDKDYESVLKILKPKVKRVEIIPIESQRATTMEKIENALIKAGLPYSRFENRMNQDESYLVFGSFYVVEAFLDQFEKREDVSK